SIIKWPSRPRAALFPYTTLFRSERVRGEEEGAVQGAVSGVGEASPEDRGRACRVSARAGARGRCTRASRSTSRKMCSCSFSSSRSEEHTSELQSRFDIVCRLLLE